MLGRLDERRAWTQHLDNAGEDTMKVGDLVSVAHIPSGLDYGIGVIIAVESGHLWGPRDGDTEHRYLVSWVSKGFRQWRGHHELRRLQ